MLSGKAWCAQFPTSRSIEDLVEPFRSNCRKFLDDLQVGGAKVLISATLRPRSRAWLMHWAWNVGREGFDPAKVPAHPGIEIEWTVEGAREMVAGYGIAYQPALTSRHIEGRAIDMTINGWKGTPEALHQHGATFGVLKLISDPPHWSDDGK